MYEYYKFDLIPLLYPYNALEPYIDTKTMMYHHDKHLRTYVDNLNHALSKYPAYQKWSLEKLIRSYKTLPKDIQTTVKNNAGGVYNHNLLFNIMGPQNNESSAGILLKSIDLNFGSFEEFQEKFKKSALDQFGSGYAWLAANSLGQLMIVNTANQDTVLNLNLSPVLLIDVWEHAYYLKYQNRRAEYIDNWFHTINWESAQANYIYCLEHNRY